MSFLVIALAVLAVAMTCYGTFVRPAQKRHVAAPAIPEPEPLPEPRVPRDLARPYPRPKGGRRRQDSVCPVCGTGDKTGLIDGRVLGWRAHPSCAEWLGDWKPMRPAPPPYKPDEALIGYVEQGQKQSVRIQVNDSPGVQVNVGDRNEQGTRGIAAATRPVMSPETSAWISREKQAMHDMFAGNISEGEAVKRIRSRPDDPGPIEVA